MKTNLKAWKRSIALMLLLVVSGLLLSACSAATNTPVPVATTAAPKPTTAAPAANTVAPAATTAAVVATTAAPVATTAAPIATTAAAAKKGGTAKIALYQEPSTLNTLFSGSTVEDELGNIVFDGLIGITPDGTYVPQLAAEVPTQANGGVSADGLVVTYKLKKDVKWADGKPFTANDVVFTYKVIMDDANALPTSGYSSMASVEAKDDTTLVVTYKKLYPPYLTRFSYILPTQAFDGKTAIEKSDFNRKPFGTGPFRVTAWKSGESITYEKNPNYREPGKPALDGLIIKIVPSREAGIQAFQTNEVDVVWDLTEAQVPSFEKFNDATLAAAPAADTERILLNLSNPSGDKPGDPATPHPILGDLKVRQALQSAINKKLIVDRLLFGKSTVGSSVLPGGWYAAKVDPSDYSLDKAKTLLDEAGWKPGADGIREKGGVRMKLTFGTTSGNKLREQTQQVIQEQLKLAGIELEIKNVPSSVLFGSWSDGSARKKGTFDLLMWTTGPGIDPDNHLFNYFHSSSIPSDANKGAGANYSRWKNAQVDDALDAAAKTLDPAKRAASYGIVAKKIGEEIPSIQLYNRLTLNAFKKSLSGFANNVYVGAFWNTQDWSISK